MTTPVSLPDRHQAARLLAEVCRPASAAILAQLPPRPGATIAAGLVRQRAALAPRSFWNAIARLQSVGILRHGDGQLALDRHYLEQTLSNWVADSPLNTILRSHPRLSSFVAWGRWVRTPIEPELIEEMYAAFSELFESGEKLTEPEVNARITEVYDDPAEIRRALVDRALLLREPGTARYLKPPAP